MVRRFSTYCVGAMVFVIALALCPVVAGAATVPVGTETALRTAITSAGTAPTTLLLTADITVHTPAVTIPAGADITIEGPHGLTMVNNEDVLWVFGSLTLIGDTFITHAGGALGSGIYIAPSGSVLLQSATITNNTTTATWPNGGGVWNEGTFTMTGGLIQLNTAGWDGGGLYNVGTALLSGGTITQNSADWGGGVANYGTLTLNGVLIDDNTAAGSGGGVYNGSTVTLASGTISNNTAHAGGGLFNDEGGLATISGGTIVTNHASTHGGGIFNVGTLNESGGTITSNTAVEYGGGVYSTVASVVFNDVTVTYNESEHGAGLYFDCITANFTFNGDVFIGNGATGHGGGIFANANSVLIAGGTVSANSASHGGGVYMTTTGGTLTLRDVTISENTATGPNLVDGNGGGVFAKSAVIVEGATIKDNHATRGGGIYITDGLGASLDVRSGSLTGNIAVTNGGGIWIARAELANLTTAAGVVFSGNKALGPYDRDPADDALYASHILSAVWSTPLKQGYNNWDIAYVSQNAVPRFTVTFAPGAHGAFTTVTYIDVLRDSATPAPTTPTPASGWKFAGWSPALASTVTGNVVYTAQWVKDEPLGPFGDGVTLWVPLALTFLGFVCIGDAVRRKH